MHKNHHFFIFKFCIHHIIIEFRTNIFIVIQWFLIKFFFGEAFNLIPYFIVFFNNFSLLAKRFTYLSLLSKCLVYPVSCGSFMFNGNGKALSLCIYPI